MKRININQPIYLDSHATTPVDQDVLDSMLPYFTRHFGNGNHKAGWKTSSVLEESRFIVSSFIGARPSETIFTSGATESINLGILGLAMAQPGKRNHIVTQRTEHSAVLSCMETLKKRGFKISILGVDPYGRIDLDELKELVTEETLLVAIMLANNEIGTVQPIKEIGKRCREVGAKFFCDLTQGIGWHPINVDEMGIDLAAMSAHKIYGPRGIGALYVRRKNSKLLLNPILFGGGQEQGLRPGTVNIPGIVGFGKAVEILKEQSEEIFARIRLLRDQLHERLTTSIKEIKLNGCPVNRHPGNLNIAIPNVSGEDLLGALPNIIFSTGSACTSGSTKPSHVITSLGVDESVLRNSFRLGIGKYNTSSEIEYVAAKIIRTVNQIQTRRERKLS